MQSQHRMCFALVILLIIPALLFAQDNSSLNRILKTRELRVGTSGSQPPFTEKSKEGTLMGYEVELARILAEAMNLEVKFVVKTFPELLPAL